MEQTIIIVPLSRLVLSDENVRKGKRTNIESLAQTILRQGVLENLVVHKVGSKGGKDIYGVDDGGRRLEALQLLLEQGEIKATYGVPCRVVESTEAVAASLTTNTEREAMSPVDELLAFRRLIEDEDKSVEDVAALYGVMPTVVRRRLRLANLAPALLDEYRQGNIDLESLTAFAVSEDHERQLKVWQGLPEYQRHADIIRERMTENEIASTDPLMKFVGLAAYTRAGGQLREDLFSDRGLSYALDVDLVRSLAHDKLKAKAAKVAGEDGAAWHEGRLTLDHADRSEFKELPTVSTEPTKKQAAQLAKLNRRRQEIDEQIEAAADEDDVDALHDEREDIDAEISQIESTLQVPDPRAAKSAGVIVTIDHTGRAKVLRGLLREADYKAYRAATKGAQATDGERPAEEPRQSSGLSGALTATLAAHFTAALRARLAESPGVALRALTASLAGELVGALNAHQGGLRVHVSAPSLAAAETEIEQGRAGREHREIEDGWRAVLAGVTDVFGWLMQQKDETVLGLLAYLVAEGVDATHAHHGHSPQTLAVAKAAGLDMRDYWKVTPESFLSRVPKATIIEAVTEADPTADVTAIEKAKKAEAITIAVPILQGAGWIPSVLRTEEVTAQ